MVSNRVQKLSFLMMLCLAVPAAAADTGYLIFPLENLTKVPTLAWVGEGVAVSISEECRVPGVDTIGWQERVRFTESVDLPPNVTLSRASMIRVAQRAGVDRLVYGSYTGTEENLRLSLRMLDLKTMKLSGEMTANGPVSALPQLENELAWLILSDGGYNGALTRADFKARTRTVPDKAYAYFISCLSVTDESQRFNLLQKALEQHRNFPQAAFLLGAYSYRSGDCAKAIQHLKTALGGRQNFLETEFMLGTCYLRQDNPPEAISALRAIVERGYPAVEVLNNLGVAYLRSGDYALAAQSLVQARRLARADDLTVGMNLVVLRHMEGDAVAMLALLEDLVKSHPEQGMLQYLFARALDSQGQGDKAAAARALAAKLGINAEQVTQQDPRTWTRLYTGWTRRLPASMAEKAATNYTNCTNFYLMIRLNFSEIWPKFSCVHG